MFIQPGITVKMFSNLDDDALSQLGLSDSELLSFRAFRPIPIVLKICPLKAFHSMISSRPVWECTTAVDIRK